MAKAKFILFSFKTALSVLLSVFVLINRHKIQGDFIKVAVSYCGLLPSILLFNHQEMLVTHLRDTNITQHLAHWD